MRNKKQDLLTIALGILTLLVVNNSSYSQEKKDRWSNEIGIGIAYFPGLIFTPNISFKHNINRNVIRAGLSYNTYSRHSILGNIGYERRLFGPNLQMIIGADICYLNRFREITNNSNSSPNYSRTFYHWGTGPVIGGILKFKKRFSFQTELGFYYGYGKYSYDYKSNPYYTIHRAFSLSVYYAL
jgi:hypothetical protein